MSFLESPTRNSLCAKSTSLRAELKDWEKSFATKHEGRKAGRDDIRKAADIATKYKEYNRIRDILAGKLPPSAAASSSPGHQPQARKRKRTDEEDVQLSRLAVPLVTPTRRRHRDHDLPSQLDPYESPSTLRKLFSPHSSSPKVTLFHNSIGPTPQRDGKVLGLFDLMSNSGGSRADTKEPDQRAPLNDLAPQTIAAQTPSRTRRSDLSEGVDDAMSPMRRRHSRTPASAGKKLLLSKFFATPTTLRFAAIAEDEEKENTRASAQDPAPADPAATGESLFEGPETPAFLRRSFSQRLRSAAHEGMVGGTSPVTVRMPPTLSQGRSLSQLVQGLRELEDERLEEDMDVLREIEAEEQGELEDHGSVDVPSSEWAADGSLAPDRTAKERESAPPAKVWKKRGQKRTTKRVIMRPVWTKAKAEPNPSVDEESEEDEPSATDGTQIKPRRKGSGLDHQQGDEQDVPSDLDEDFLDTAEGHTAKGTKTKEKQGKKAMKELVVEKKSTKRKVKPEAHANYRTLKIRNKHSKGSKGRFGRRGR